MNLRFFTFASLIALLAACADPSTSDDATLDTESDELTSEPVVGGPTNGGCSDATASLVYTAWRHQGGARPGNGMVIGGAKLVRDGNIAGQTTLREGGVGAQPDDNVPWAITLRFVASTKKVLQTTGNPQAGSQTYSQKVKGRLVNGLGPSIAANTFETWVVCENQWNHMLP